MSKMKYLYIDDEYNPSLANNVQPIAERLMRTQQLQIDLQRISSFEEVVSELRTKLVNYDGLILDLQLNDKPNEEGKRFPSNAPTLAQHIRNEETNIKTSIPIILCSTNTKIKQIYSKDKTSHDLFDMNFVKEIRVDNQGKEANWDTIILRLYSLAEGYKLLHQYKGDFGEILRIDISNLDPRIFSRFEDSYHPTSEYAHYILNDLINIPGPLVSESLMAARIGIDLKDSDDWPQLLSRYFLDSKYTGVFSSGWNRWWMDKVLKTFETLTKQSLHFIDARERVNLLKKATDLSHLKHADLIPNCKSYRYWCLCKGFGKPMDPREGFKVNPSVEPQPWQDYEFISLEAMLERKGFENAQIVIHATDKERFKQEKENHLHANSL